MSTIKSSNEHLTLNADGSSKDIKFQANGVEKASISSAGAFTSTTIDATKLTGNLPAISGAALTGLSAADNTPSVRGRLSSDQSFSASTWTKINWDTEDWDTDSAFASYKFTVPSGEAGKYLIGWSVAMSGAADNQYGTVVVYKNGSIDLTTRSTMPGSQNIGEYYTGNTVSLSLAATDYIELYGMAVGAGDFLANRSSFFITKLAGV